jgi:hypothetical protein
MGNLKPNASYIYERVDGVVYAREIGSESMSREAIGWDFDSYPEGPSFDILKESRYWREILIAFRSNHLLKEALDRVKIIYELSKQDGKN